MITQVESKSKVRKRVLIVGGGFAGLSCARALAEVTDLSVTLIDRNNYQQFQPLLYQVAIGSLSPSNAAFNLRSVFRKSKSVDVKLTEVVHCDLPNRSVTDKYGDIYRGDYLVLAAGAEPNFFEIPGLERYSCPMYSLVDAERLRSRILELLETADRRHRTEEKPLHFVVVGGGPTGVETAGALADAMHRMPDKTYSGVDPRQTQVTLIDASHTLLAPFSNKSQDYTTRKLQERGVELRMNTSVKEVTQTQIFLSDGTCLDSNLLVWAGGLKASRLSGSTDLKLGHGGRIDVQPDLKIPGFDGAYALGDFANVNGEDGKPLPQLASVAQQAGHHCAKNIKAALSGQPSTPFKYFDKGIMAMIGRNAAVAEIGGNRYSLAGPLAFAAWLGVHAMLLTTTRAKLESFLEWAWEYFGSVHVDAILYQRGSQAIASAQPPTTR